MMTRKRPAFAPALALAFATAISLIAPVASVHAQATAQTELARVSDYIRAVRTLKADFSQTDRMGQTITGQLTLKQPGKIRFQYQKDAGLLIVGDGKALTMIDYQVGQVQRWPIGSSPLAALIDPSRDIARFSKVIPTADPNVLTVEAHDPKRPEFGTITLVFNRKPSAPAGLELYGWVARDVQNNRTAVRLTNHVYGATVDDSAFRWRDPRAIMRPGGR